MVFCSCFLSRTSKLREEQEVSSSVGFHLLWVHLALLESANEMKRTYKKNHKIIKARKSQKMRTKEHRYSEMGLELCFCANSARQMNEARTLKF